jgi:Spy/CpxP family protein refolding chaperone
MKQIRHYMLLAVCAVALAVWGQQSTPPQTAQPHEHMGQMGHDHGPMSADEHLQMLSQRLNLTDEQKTKIKPIIEEHLQQRQAIMKDESLTPEQKHSKMQASMESARHKIEPLLNDEQKKQLAQMMAEHGQGKGMHDHDAEHKHQGDQKKDDRVQK